MTFILDLAFQFIRLCAGCFWHSLLLHHLSQTALMTLDSKATSFS